jgi:hypothetical protein
MPEKVPKPADRFLLSAVGYHFGERKAAAQLSEAAAKVPPEELGRLSENAAYHELEPLLHLISTDCSELGNPLGLPEELESNWARTYRRELARTAIIHYGASKAISALAEAQVRAVPLKGYFFSSAIYERQGARPFRDLDLLVEKASLPAMDKALRGAGFIPQPARPSFVPAPAYTVYALPLEESDMAMEVDIHIGMHWPEEYHRRTGLRTEELWSQASEGEAGGQHCWRLSPVHLAITTLLDVAVNHRYARLIKFRDMLELCRKCSLDWNEMEYTCHRWRIRSYVGPGLRFAAALHPDLDIPEEIKAAILPSYPLMKVFLRALPPASLPSHRSRSFTPPNLIFFLLADTPSERARGLLHVPFHMLKGFRRV